jgi:hypothetical protein
MKLTKHNPLLFILLASLILASSALAQTTLSSTAESRQSETGKYSSASDAISTARSQYTQIAEAENVSSQAEDGMTIAQFSPRNGPMRPFPPNHAYPRGSYQSPWMDHNNGRHVLIGAVIGFGLGAALGAKANKNPNPGTTTGAVVLVGGVGALIGAAIGGAHGGPYPFAHHKRIHPPFQREGEEPDFIANSIGSNSIRSSSERKSTPRFTNEATH